MFDLVDSYCWDKHKKILTRDYHHIRGLNNFTYWNLTQAIDPSPLHYHKNAIEIHCILKGVRSCSVEDTPYTITGNEIFMTFPGEKHGSGNLPQNPFEFYGLQIDISDPAHILGLDENTSRILCDLLLRHKENRHLKMAPESAQFLRNAFDLISSFSSPADLCAGSQYICCFLFSLRGLEPVSRQKQIRSQRIEDLLSYIAVHFRDNPALTDLADYTGYSLSRFKAKFKEEVGITPADYITLQKIEYAKTQLRTSSDSIAQIGMDAGFSSVNYFCSVFRKLTTCTPGEYRELHSK